MWSDLFSQYDADYESMGTWVVGAYGTVEMTFLHFGNWTLSYASFSTPYSDSIYKSKSVSYYVEDNRPVPLQIVGEGMRVLFC